MKKKCHKCGTIDSIHLKNTATSKLIGDIGLKDTDGLVMYNIYCRNCQTINIYKPGWFFNTKFNKFYNMNRLKEEIGKGTLVHEDIVLILGERITSALREDGVL